MLGLLYKLGLKKYIDYRIVGEYYDSADGMHYTRKFVKKYYLKSFKKKGN